MTGLPVCLCLQRLLVEFRYDLPTGVDKPISRLAPWNEFYLISLDRTIMRTNRDKTSRTMIDVQTAFQA